MANDAVRCEPVALIYQYVGDRAPNRSPALKQINTGDPDCRDSHAPACRIAFSTKMKCFGEETSSSRLTCLRTLSSPGVTP
jgi:hypothetical protein